MGVEKVTGIFVDWAEAKGLELTTTQIHKQQAEKIRRIWKAQFAKVFSPSTLI
jgi:hypothetical protein